MHEQMKIVYLRSSQDTIEISFFFLYMYRQIDVSMSLYLSIDRSKHRQEQYFKTIY